MPQVLPNTLIEFAPRVSTRIVPALKRLGIRTARDLLFYFPSRYEDYSNLKKIADLATGEIATIQGRVQKISLHRTARKHMALTEATVEDDSGTIKAIWFNQPFLARTLKAGDIVNLSGKITIGKYGACFQNPAQEKISKFKSLTHTGGLVAIYPETEGISSRWLRYLIKSVLDLRKQIPDPLPPETRSRHKLPALAEALRAIHFPRTREEAYAAEQRFSFEELLLIHLRALRERMRMKQLQAPAIPLDLALIKKFVQSLPFALTDAQRRSIWEILQDISKPRPMNRLLEGDVGSGKTVVAAAAALLTVKTGHKAAFMAPTEILARQHYATLEKILSQFDIKIGLLIGAEKKIRHDTDIVIGTHALIHPVRNKMPRASTNTLTTSRISNGVQKNVRFEKLGLVIVDEQHRFGVDQRAALMKNHDGPVPHFLSMSATPIPRTLALTIYGDLDLSILDEMPKSRKSIITKIVEPGEREKIYQFIRQEVERRRQVFVICPRIEIGEQTNPARNLVSNGADTKNPQRKILFADVRAVETEFEKLSKEIFPDLRIAKLHGRMKSKEKDAVMKRFQNKECDVLVSTSVVEVGVDIPNATIMMIEGAERFGLAQLHQFRGRVGRGAEQSYCFLFPTENGATTRRLRAVVDAKNGFELAEKDLEIRGPGDIFGNRQWGVATSVLKAITNAELVRTVRQEAIYLLKQDPILSMFPALRDRLAALKKTIHLE